MSHNHGQSNWISHSFIIALLAAITVQNVSGDCVRSVPSVNYEQTGAPTGCTSQYTYAKPLTLTWTGSYPNLLARMFKRQAIMLTMALGLVNAAPELCQTEELY